MSSARHVVVLGGGITGLAAVHELLRAGEAAVAPPARVSLVEADRRLGGKVRSDPIASQRIDVGAESLMARSPAAIDLCRQLGLGEELVAATEVSSVLWTRGRLRPLPPGILGGLPAGVRPVLASRILSPTGIARAAMDLLLPASRWRDDEPVTEIVRRRLGAQALDRLVDPLLGTIYGADCESLSVRATAPQIDRIARAHRSLIRGLLSATAPPTGADGPLFVTLPGGLERIVERLRARAEGAAELRLGVRAVALARGPEGRYLLRLSDGSQLMADGVVIATPADQAALVLDAIAPIASLHLRSIPYSSTVVVTLRCSRAAVPAQPAGAGLLVPAGERKLLGACTFSSAKWPHLKRTGELWLRCSVARASVAEAMAIDDSTLVRRIAGELRDAIGLTGSPLDARVTRWRRSLPVYRPGHLERVAHIERELARLASVEVAGAAYRGMGVPQCIAQGEEAARRVLEQLQDAPQDSPAARPAFQTEGATR